ncbi:MAG: TIGR02679 family protein [Pseudomonadota bacterium]|nr:TIGR02679 family protein [Pseudomonadota bacterium]
MLERLPAAGIALSTLAAETLGDAHGIDPGTPVSTLVRRAILCLNDEADDDGFPDETDTWAGAGVLVGGGITSQALVLNLPAANHGATARVLRTLAADGEPAYLTLRQLLRSRPSWDVVGKDVFICENPAVVAEAANQIGSACRPLICTQGQPSAAVATLLRQLGRARATLHYHGDFDWPGIRIAGGLIRRFGTLPWRFSTLDYLAAPDTAKALSGRPAETSWDTGLEEAMRERDQAVEEEIVLATLLDDLRSA